MTELTARELLVMLYDTALDAVDGHLLVNQWCRNNKYTYTHCVAIGKAAPAMLQGVLDYAQPPKKSLLICPPAKLTRALKKNKSVNCLTASHPVPDASSLEAGQQLILFLSQLEANDKLLFLISGGTSSLVEILRENVTLEQLQEINNYLLASGKNIHQMNAWRQQFSAIKAGGLLHWIKCASVTQLLLSDVKDDRAEFIGSGLLINTTTEIDDDSYLATFVPVKKSATEKTVASILVHTHIIGNIDRAMLAVYETAKSENLESFIHEEFIEGDVLDVAAKLYAELKEAEAGIHIWGGETTVRLPGNPGIGGRNQLLALAFSQYLKDTPNLYLLAAGTDGVDGNSHCAGAVVSSYTSQKAKSMGFDIKAEIAKANAGVVLMATDDLVRGGHSNTNVMDIIIAYKAE